MGLSQWQSHCESSPGSFDKCRMVVGIFKVSKFVQFTGLPVLSTPFSTQHAMNRLVTFSTGNVY